ncbi:PEGA domain-containing protein [Persephonella hydrogeniphila]|uniref:PEGA domain-containing protein n=1 Tax=Persephonella hydrogeniphila TaxID=198703 RepID=A0A285N4J6_9AQUI|nr:PEGA domain-containing protein [Persephonella hydrogeniphila]SNZ02651.1 PEGA domain-containing protein [Persephonella hydrogeniphila]
MKKALTFFLFFVAAVFITSCEGKGKLVIKEPPNAKVYINGKYVGDTPLEIELKEGKYTVEVATSPFDMERKKNVWVYFDHTTELTFHPKPKGILIADTKPQGATVLEGRNPLGKTPFKDKLDVGEHHLVFKLGAVGTSRIVTIEYGKTTKLFVNLEKAVVHFDANPEDAVLYIDGKKIGTFPQNLELEEGTHEILVQKNQYKDKFVLKVKKGDEITVMYVLKAVQLPPIQAYGPITFTPDKKYLVTLGKAGIYFWDIKEFKPQISLYDPKDVRNFDKFINYGISEDGRYVVGIKPIRKLAYALPEELKGKKVDKILIWDMKTTFPVLSKLYPMESIITAVSKDKKKIYFITKDGKIKIAQMNSGNIISEKDIGYTPYSGKYIKGKIYIGTDNGNVVVFDTVSDTIISKIKVHQSRITDIEATNDGKEIITSSTDGYIKISTPEMKTIKEIKIGTPVYCATLSPSKTKLAVGKQNKSIEVKELSSGKTLYTIQNLRFVPISVVFADEEVLITGASIKEPEIDIFRNGHLMKKWIQTIR